MSYYPKTCNFTICSIFSNSGHVGWSAGSLDITFKGNPLRMIQAKFGLNWPSGFRGEDFWKSLQTDDGRRTPSDGNSSHRWAKKEEVSVNLKTTLTSFKKNPSPTVSMSNRFNCIYFFYWNVVGYRIVVFRVIFDFGSLPNHSDRYWLFTLWVYW